MDLIVFELGASGNFSKDPVTKQITPTKNLNVVALRPHLWIQGAPGGTVKMQILDTSSKVIAESAARTVAGMKTLTYSHGFFYFAINAHLKKDTPYLIGLRSGGGYTYSDTNFVAWCNAFDLGRQNPSYSNNVGINAPLNCEIWTKNMVSRGAA